LPVLSQSIAGVIATHSGLATGDWFIDWLLDCDWRLAHRLIPGLRLATGSSTDSWTATGDWFIDLIPGLATGDWLID
jgi:hypothetical protein